MRLGKRICMEGGDVEQQKRKLFAEVSEPWFLPALAAMAEDITALSFPATLLPKGTTLHSPLI